MTLDTLIKSLQAFLQNHKTVKRFRFDFEDQIDIFAELSSDYPLVFASPVTSFSISNNNGYFGTQYSLKLTILDRMNEDRSNVFTILNESNNIINDIIIWFKNSGITITDDQYIIDDINDQYSHRLTGKSLIINFLVDAQTDCVYPVYDCEDGKFIIINSLGDEKQFTVPSGQEINHNIQDSDFELSVYDTNNNLIGTYNYSIPAYSIYQDDLILNIMTQLNVKNSDGSYDNDITSDLILPDTDFEIKLKNSENTLVDTINYTRPSVGSYSEDIVLDDVEVNIYVNNVFQETVYVPYDKNENIDIG